MITPKIIYDAGKNEQVHPDYLKYRMVFDQVVLDILDGQLKHDQTEWHCGTAHCVRGWFEVKAAKHFYNQNYDSVTEMFVDDDGYHAVSAIFDASNATKKDPTEEVAYLTGYDYLILECMFGGQNTVNGIKKYAQQLNIVKNNHA